MGMFTHVFLGGHFTKNWSFIIDLGTWWLGAFYVLVYLWTLNVIAGIQRSATAATVSQWYFHRFDVPAASAQAVVRAALGHALTTSFGTICLSTLLTLLVRLPILILPGRIMAVVGFFSNAFLPGRVVVLMHPTTLTYAAIHSQPLTEAARAVAQLSFMNRPGARFGAISASKARASASSANLPHRLALLLLYSTRLLMSMALGFAAWVNTARSLAVGEGGTAVSATVKGSLYAYVVGLIAGAIGWGVLGAMEGVLTGVVDAVVVCWESEVRGGGGEGKYCREAGWLLGDGGESRVGKEPEDGDREGLLRH